MRVKLFGKSQLASSCLQLLINAAWYGFLFYVVFTLALIASVATRVEYFCKFTPVHPHAFLLALSAAIGIITVFAVRWLKKTPCHLPHSNSGFCWTILLLSAVLLALEMGLTRAIGFYTGWDVGTLTYDMWDVHDRSVYFSMYPNQLFIEGVFRRIVALADIVGISNGYDVLVFGSCVCVTCATALSAFCARRLGNATSGYAAFFLTAFLWGLSPWVVIPYTDTYGILWPILVLFFYLCVDHPEARIVGIVASSILGYAVKPTVVFTPMSIIAIEVLQGAMNALALHEHGSQCGDVTSPEEKTASPTFQYVGDLLRQLPWQCIASCAVCCALTFGATVGVVNRIRDWGMEINPEGAYTYTHYLMLGVNERHGLWSQNDIDISNSFDTVEERQAGNIAEWRRRVKNLGVSGVSMLLLKKDLCNYADGSYSWGEEGHFFQGTYGSCAALQAFYGVRPADADPIPYPFKEIYHVVWLLVLLGVTCYGLKAPEDNRLVMISLSLFMLSVFLLVFECRARYLFLYGPFFSILSVLGWRSLGHRMFQRMNGKL